VKPEGALSNHRVIALFLAVGLWVGVAHGQQVKAHDGYWWTDSSESFRLGFVTGYLMAMNSVSDANLVKCAADRSGGKKLDSKDLRVVLEECVETADVKWFSEFGGFRVGQWSDGVNEFYRDFRNKGLEIALAMHYVKDQLHGKPAKELEDEVTEWRRSAAK